MLCEDNINENTNTSIKNYDTNKNVQSEKMGTILQSGCSRHYQSAYNNDKISNKTCHDISTNDNILP